MAVKAKAEVTLASIKDVASVTRYYLLQSSSSAIPAKPTTNPPGGNWVRTEPSYTTGSTNSLYFTDLTVFSDGTFTYSDVSLSSSYEAAKVAYNKAVAAQDHIDTLEIGGRNLARGTGDTTGIHWVMSRATEANGVLTITPTTSAGYGKYIMDYLLYGENANQTFTLSFDAREIESASGYGTGAINVYMGVQSPSRIDSILQSAYDRYGGKTLDVAGTGWNRYSVSFTFPSDITTGQASAFTDDAIISFEFGRARNTCPLEVKNCKLERGAKATDWTPAPEDVSKYTDDSVNAIEIGGNNLYAVCNQVYGYLNTSGGISAPTAAKCKTSDYIPVSEGEHYVFQAWVPSIGASQQLWIGYVFYSDTSGTRVGGRTAKYATAGEKYLAYTDITVPANATYIRVSYRQYEDGYCKLEKGNKPTDWSPAPEDVDSRITGTNLSPFFSYTPYVVGDYWTTWPTGNGYVFTPKGDGWVRIQKDNSTGSSLVRHDIYMTRAEMVRPGSDYTMLFEFRNNNSTGDSADSNVYIVQGTNTQFWGNSIKKILEGVNSNTASTSLISDFPPGTSGVYRKRFVKTSEPSDSSHWTGSEAVYLTCLTFRCAANSTIDYEVRISLYEGECIGPYKPYGVDVGDFAAVKDTANDAAVAADNAQATADNALDGVENVRLYAESSIDQRADEIELSISTITGTLTTDIQDCQDAIAATEDALTGSVNDLSSRVLTQEEALQAYQHQTSTYFRFNADGLNIGKQSDGDDSPYSINIDNEKMGFLQNGVEIAYVQYNKMHINAIEAMDRMSVGAASDGGYFDFISTVYGMGVKWRSVAQSQPVTMSAPRLMAVRSASYVAVRDEEGIFSVDFGGGDQK